MSQSQIERMANKVGKQKKAPKYDVPLLKFNGNTGNFRKLDFQEGTDEGIDPPKFITLKMRSLLSSYSPQASYWTNEYESPNQIVSLFRRDDGGITHQGNGTPGNLRDNFPEARLRTKKALYGLYEDEVCKLEVRGASLGNFFDYQRELDEAGLHNFQVYTVTGVQSTENEAGMKYKVMTFDFEKHDKDLDKIEKTQTEIHDNLAQVDEYFSPDENDSEPVKVVGDTEAVTEAKQADPDPDDIPF